MPLRDRRALGRDAVERFLSTEERRRLDRGLRAQQRMGTRTVRVANSEVIAMKNISGSALILASGDISPEDDTEVGDDNPAATATTLSTSDRVFLARAQRFLVGIQDSEFTARALRQGYSDAEHKRGFALFREAMGEGRPLEHWFRESALADDGGGRAETLLALDTFENLWFPRVRAIIRRMVPSDHRDAFEASFFKDLEQQPLGPGVVGSVSGLLTRVEGLAMSAQPGAKEVLETLRARGLTLSRVAESERRSPSSSRSACPCAGRARKSWLRRRRVSACRSVNCGTGSTTGPRCSGRASICANSSSWVSRSPRAERPRRWTSLRRIRPRLRVAGSSLHRSGLDGGTTERSTDPARLYCSRGRSARVDFQRRGSILVKHSDKSWTHAARAPDRSHRDLGLPYDPTSRRPSPRPERQRRLTPPPRQGAIILRQADVRGRRARSRNPAPRRTRSPKHPARHTTPTRGMVLTSPIRLTPPAGWKVMVPGLMPHLVRVHSFPEATSLTAWTRRSSRKC